MYAFDEHASRPVIPGWTTTGNQSRVISTPASSLPTCSAPSLIVVNIKSARVLLDFEDHDSLLDSPVTPSKSVYPEQMVGESINKGSPKRSDRSIMPSSYMCQVQMIAPRGGNEFSGGDNMVTSSEVSFILF